MNNESKRRPTQQDIADLAGVHRTTVSLSLKNHPNIPEVTREKVRRIANEIGYMPDPMLSALAVYRTLNRAPTYQGTVAWLVNNLPPFKWNKEGIFCQYYEGAKKQALSYGFNLETFDLQSKGISANRLANIFRSRNIRGILLCPQPNPRTELDFPWDDFSLVTFGFSLVRPQVHTVAATQFRAMVQLVRKLRELGHRRIGCMVQHDERSDHNYAAGYLAEVFFQDERIAIPPLHPAHSTAEDFAHWYKRYKPTAIVGGPNLCEITAEMGLKSPEEVSLACPLLGEKSGRLSGIFENSVHIGEIAVDLLVAMMHRGERGVPQFPQRTLLEGEWYQGETVRPLGKR